MNPPKAAPCLRSLYLLVSSVSNICREPAIACVISCQSLHMQGCSTWPSTIQLRAISTIANADRGIERPMQGNSGGDGIIPASHPHGQSCECLCAFACAGSNQASSNTRCAVFSAFAALHIAVHRGHQSSECVIAALLTSKAPRLELPHVTGRLKSSCYCTIPCFRRLAGGG